MLKHPLLRDLVLVIFAAAFGWWAHGSHTVRAAEPDKSDEGNLTFQFGGTDLPGSLTVYSPSAHTLYVYPMHTGNSKASCMYMLHISRPGGPIERTNCAPGSVY